MAVEMVDDVEPLVAVAARIGVDLGEVDGVARLQVERGGLRLAKLLDQALG